MRREYDGGQSRADKVLSRRLTPHMAWQPKDNHEDQDSGEAAAAEFPSPGPAKIPRKGPCTEFLGNQLCAGFAADVGQPPLQNSGSKAKRIFKS